MFKKYIGSICSETIIMDILLLLIHKVNSNNLFKFKFRYNKGYKIIKIIGYQLTEKNIT